METPVPNQIRRIEAKLAIGDVARALDGARALIDGSSLTASECLWTLETLGPLADGPRMGKLVRRIVELAPEDERAALLLADFQRESGQFEESSLLYHQLLATNPACGRALYYLATMGALASEDIDERAVMSARGEDEALCHFALGKLAEDKGEYAEAMSRFDLANQSAERNLPASWRRLDVKQTDAEDSAIRQLFTSAFLKECRSIGLPSERPIFIVGMPRSGTTLLERILSRHPDVHAAGELPYWTQRARELIEGMRTRPVGKLRMAEGYEDLLNRIAPDARRIVNKNPMNAKLVGALHILFPNARFIWCSRQPIDHCLSMYKTFGGAPKDMAFSKRLLVDGYLLNDRLMNHWLKAIPGDRILSITYETLVREFEGTARRIVDFCGLEWSARILEQQSGGLVRTPSAWQVCQPIYSSSLDVWRHYEPWLGEFRELMVQRS